MQTNLIGRAAIAELDVLNPAANGDAEWSPGCGQSYWVKQSTDVEIVAAYTTGTHHIPAFIVVDGDGKLHCVEVYELKLAPPVHPFR